MASLKIIHAWKAAMLISRAFLILVLVGATSTAWAQSKSKVSEMGTPEQRAACGPDVRRFCKAVDPEDGQFAYLACLKANRAKLRTACIEIIGGDSSAAPRSDGTSN